MMRNVPGDDACVLVVDDSRTIRFALKEDAFTG